jgi:hypothetical protein
MNPMLTIDGPDSSCRNKSPFSCRNLAPATFAEKRLSCRPSGWPGKIKRAGTNPALLRIPILPVVRARFALSTEMQTALETPPYTQPVGFGRPAILQAPFPGPEGKSS